MARRLFCEINPFTYALSVRKMQILRKLKDLFSDAIFAKKKGSELPVVIYKYNSLIRRKLGNVDMRLQENKASNLSLAAPKLNGILIRPGETFSFWRLVGSCTKRKGYREGLIISSGKPSQGVGGGMCQFTNLLHWLVLHSPLDIVEHHHHDGIDMFPDYGRQVPFGCGTSIMFNYLDYRFKNNTEHTYQVIVYVTDTYLCGELRASEPLDYSYHIIEEDAHFVKSDDVFYRRNKIVRQMTDKRSGNIAKREIIKESNARVLYDEEYIDENLLR